MNRSLRVAAVCLVGVLAYAGATVITILAARRLLKEQPSAPSTITRPATQPPPPAQPTYEERRQREFDITAKILTDFMNQDSTPQALQTLADDDGDCLAIVERIERKFTTFQRGRKDDYHVQAKRLEEIGEELDKLVEKLESVNWESDKRRETKDDYDELRIMTGALHERLKAFCLNVANYKFKWRVPEISYFT